MVLYIQGGWEWDFFHKQYEAKFVFKFVPEISWWFFLLP